MDSIRKQAIVIEEIRKEAGRSDGMPLRRVAILASVANPYAGLYCEDLEPLMKLGDEIGEMMGQRVLSEFGGDAANIEAYGKGAIVGLAGEIEHGYALITRPFAMRIRRAFGDATAWMAANVKRSGAGGCLDVPLAYKNALYVRSHYDTMEVRLPDAPLPDEVVVVLAATNRGRLNARIGGLKKEHALNKDARDIYVDAD